MDIKKMVRKYFEDKQEEIITVLNDLRDRCREKGEETGLRQFSYNAVGLMDKVDNIDKMLVVIDNMDFIYETEVNNEKHYSKYGTYCDWDKFYYNDKLLSIGKDDIVKVVINEIIYSVFKNINDNYWQPEDDLHSFYYALGVVYTGELVRNLTELRKRLKETENEYILIENNIYSLNKRIEKTEDNPRNFVVDLKNGRIRLMYLILENNKKRIYRNVIKKSRFDKGIVY